MRKYDVVHNVIEQKYVLHLNSSLRYYLHLYFKKWWKVGDDCVCLSSNFLKFVLKPILCQMKEDNSKTTTRMISIDLLLFFGKNN